MFRVRLSHVPPSSMCTRPAENIPSLSVCAPPTCLFSRSTHSPTANAPPVLCTHSPRHSSLVPCTSPPRSFPLDLSMSRREFPLSFLVRPAHTSPLSFHARPRRASAPWFRARSRRARLVLIRARPRPTPPLSSSTRPRRAPLPCLVHRPAVHVPSRFMYSPVASHFPLAPVRVPPITHTPAQPCYRSLSLPLLALPPCCALFPPHRRPHPPLFPDSSPNWS